MVYVTGDCHGDYRRFSTDRFRDQKEMTRDDLVIVCGDFGIWDNGKDEQYWLKWLEKKPFTTVFVDGNHENFDRLYGGEFKTVDFHGGKAQQIRPHIFHLLRGEMYTFEGKKFWCFGGAQSHDISDGILDADDFTTPMEFYATVRQWSKYGKTFRINHISWWEQELPSQEEMDHGMQVLEENGFEADYIISHCCPQDVASVMGYHGSDRLTMYFNDVARKTKFTRWYFGHYHGEETVFGKFILHYDKIERIL